MLNRYTTSLIRKKKIKQTYRYESAINFIIIIVVVVVIIIILSGWESYNGVSYTKAARII